MAAAGLPRQARAGRAGDLNRALRSFSLRASGKGVVVVLSDFMDKGGYEDGLRYLVARQMDVYVIQILSQEEIDPAIAGDLKLMDVEDGDEAEVTVSAPLLKRYKENLARLPGAAARVLHPARHGYLFTSNQVPFDRLVLGYLAARGLVR